MRTGQPWHRITGINLDILLSLQISIAFSFANGILVYTKAASKRKDWLLSVEMCIPLGQSMRKACVNGFSREDHERWFWSKTYKSFFILFFFSSLESKDLKKTTNEDGHQSRSILALKILYRELLFFMLLCSHKSLRSIANSEKYFKFILEEENCFRV